jgi:hypothetical protein
MLTIDNPLVAAIVVLLMRTLKCVMAWERQSLDQSKRCHFSSRRTIRYTQ